MARQKKLTEKEIMQVINQLLINYGEFDLDIQELMQIYPGLGEIKAMNIVRKRYKDFIIN